MISTDFGCLIDTRNKNTMNDQVEHFIFFCTFNQFPDIAPMSNFDNCRFSVQLIWREGGHYLCRCLLLSEIEIWTLSLSGMHQYGKMIYFANRIYISKEVFQNTPYTNNVGYLHRSCTRRTRVIQGEWPNWLFRKNHCRRGVHYLCRYLLLSET